MRSDAITPEQALEEGWYKPNAEGGFCHCGCGTPTQIAKWSSKEKGVVGGCPVRFSPGHHRRGEHQTWEAREKIRTARLGITGMNHPHWKGGRVIDADGYVRIWTGPDHPMANIGGYVLEHRLVMSEHIGRMLDSNEVVHHKQECEGGTGRKDDNRIENLALFGSHSAHRLHHIATQEGS